MTNFRRVFIGNSWIFITVAINNRKRTLLTDHIEALRSAFKSVKSIYPFDIHAIAILPEHFHMIIRPDEVADYPKIISLIKINFTKKLPHELKIELSEEVSFSKIKKRESGV